MSIKAALPKHFRGDLIESLLSTVEAAAQLPQLSKAPGRIHAVAVRKRSRKQAERDYFRLDAITLPKENPPLIACQNVDCYHPAQVMVSASGEDPAPYCKDCAHVEFTHWMSGV
jgi:hypothetical protein